MMIYKILLPSEWVEFEKSGRFDGSAFDRSSGFIHCSSRAELPATALRIFGEEPTLVVVALDPQCLGDAVRWEQGPNAVLFPHVYEALPRRAVVAVHHVAGASVLDQLVPQEE